MTGAFASQPERGTRAGRHLAIRAVAVLACLLLGVGVLAGPARSSTLDGKIVPRSILALYDGGAEPDVAQTRLHRFAEMPLNYLGYKLTFWDVRLGAPTGEPIADLAAIITWFSRPLPTSSTIHSWLLSASAEGAKLIIMDDTGEASEPESAAASAALLERLGLHSTGPSHEVTFRASIGRRDPAVVGFERNVLPPFAPYLALAAIRGDVESHLTIANHGEESVVVATSSTGGYAQAGYTLLYDEDRDRVQWMINPFEFFWRALGRPLFPAPDTTTVSGRRMYFSHIDGDGWNNLSQIERYSARKASSAEVVLDELVRPYPDLPLSIGVIGGDVDEELSGPTQAARIARELFALPQIEVASHTYTHPFDWSFFEPYDRARELALIERHFRDPRSPFQRSIDWLRSVAGKPPQSLSSIPYVAFSAEMPRVYMQRSFDLETEIGGALGVATSLAPAGKTARLFLWSGEANPFEAAIREARTAGAENMNGGDSRHDVEFPSIAYVPPLSRPVGSERQVYAAASNENTYTNDWKGPFFGFSLVARTLEATERPRRLKPINIYYHMYSGEKPASLDAVRGQLEAARRQAIAPIPASLYPQIVAGFLSARIEQLGTSSWRIDTRGALQTVRFDRVAGRAVDMTSSTGVIGYRAQNGGLYVTLDPAIPAAVVSLTDEPPRSSPKPYIEQSRWRMSQVVLEPCLVSGTVQGFGNGEFVLAGLTPGSYRIALTRGSTVLQEGDAQVADRGSLDLSLGPLGIDPARLELSCRRPPAR